MAGTDTGVESAAQSKSSSQEGRLITIHRAESRGLILQLLTSGFLTSDFLTCVG
jgi:hypothetical protein